MSKCIICGTVSPGRSKICKACAEADVKVNALRQGRQRRPKPALPVKDKWPAPVPILDADSDFGIEHLFLENF